MKLLDYIQFSAKHLYKRKLRTVLTISGICVGIIFFTLMISLIRGGKQKMDEVFDYSKMLNDVTVSPYFVEAEGKEKKLREITDTTKSRSEGISKEDLAKIRSIPHVATAEPCVGVYAKSIRLEGKDDFYMTDIYGMPVSRHFANEILAGRDFQTQDKEKILLSPIYLASMGIDDPQDIIGRNIILEIERVYVLPTKKDEERMRRKMERIRYTTQEKFDVAKLKIEEEFRQELQDRPKETKEFKAEVIGIMFMNPHEGRTRAYIPRRWARELTEWSRYDLEIKEEDFYRRVSIKADGPEYVEDIVQNIQAMGFGAMSVKRMVKDLEDPIRGISLALGALSVIALIIASIGLINTMIMAIYERTREIGIMKATGATSRNIKGLFTIEAGVIGFTAGVVGVAAGYGLGLIIQRVIENAMTGVVNSPLFKDGQVDIIALNLGLVIFIIGFSTFAAMVAGYFPARRAARMDPAHALRYE